MKEIMTDKLTASENTNKVSIYYILYIIIILI